jgi:hypothetical protein
LLTAWLQRRAWGMVKAGSLAVAAGGAVLAIFVLLFRVKQGPFAYANYIIVVSFVPLLGLLLFDCLGKNIRAVALLLFIGTFAYVKAPVLDEFYFRYAHQRDADYTQQALKDYNGVLPVIQPVDGHLRVLTDYRALLPVTPFTPGAFRSDFGDNLQLFKPDYDYIVLHKANPAFGDEQKIKADFSNPDNYLQTHAAIFKLVKEGRFQDRPFKKVFENDHLFVFKSVI